MSPVGVLSRLHNAVGNLAAYIWLRQWFVAISFVRCRYFLAHVACRNLIPWQGLLKVSLFSAFSVEGIFVAKNSQYFIFIRISFGERVEELGQKEVACCIILSRLPHNFD